MYDYVVHDSRPAVVLATHSPDLQQNMLMMLYDCNMLYDYVVHDSRPVVVFATHSPDLQQNMLAPQEVVPSGQLLLSVSSLEHVLAAPPPPLVTWHTPHVPMASGTVPAKLSALPQNGLLLGDGLSEPVVHDVPLHCCYQIMKSDNIKNTVYKILK